MRAAANRCDCSDPWRKRTMEPAFRNWRAPFVRKEQPTLVFLAGAKAAPSALSMEEQSFVAEFAEALAKQQGMNAEKRYLCTPFGTPYAGLHGRRKPAFGRLCPVSFGRPT